MRGAAVGIFLGILIFVALLISMYVLVLPRTITDPLEIPAVRHVEHVFSSVEVATQEPLDLEHPPRTIDGITWEIGWRVLVRAQNHACDNGIYYIRGLQEFVRAQDFEKALQSIAGKTVHVNYGFRFENLSFTLGHLEGPVNAEGFPPAVFYPTIHDIVEYPVNIKGEAMAVSASSKLVWKPLRGPSPWSLHQESKQHVVFRAPKEIEGSFIVYVLAQNPKHDSWCLVEQPLWKRHEDCWFGPAKQTHAGCKSRSKICDIQYEGTELHVRFCSSGTFTTMSTSVVSA